MKLTFDGISSCWEESIPLGNGRMGAVLCSEPETDVLYLNDDTLWSGYPHAETSPVTPEIVAKARQASLQDDYNAATRIIKDATLQEKDEQIYEPFGTARIQYSTSADGCESMKRQLDLARALAGERSGWVMPTFMSTHGAASPMICWSTGCHRMRRLM